MTSRSVLSELDEIIADEGSVIAAVRKVDWLDRIDAYRSADPDALPSRWTPEHVLIRMIDAVEVLGRVSLSTKPQQYGNGWPSILREFSDYTDPDARKNRADEALWSLADRPDAASLSRMEEALAWPMRYLPQDALLADALMLFSTCKARGTDIAPLLRARKLKAMGMADTVVANRRSTRAILAARIARDRSIPVGGKIEALRLAALAAGCLDLTPPSLTDMLPGRNFTSRTMLDWRRKQAQDRIAKALHRDKVAVR